MKRLIRLSINSIKNIITADWKPIDIGDPSLVQIMTDVMAANAQMQINYQNSGWRLISPYGWSVSKSEGNILLMCYKDTGEIRSYRFDRILEVLIDDSMIIEIEEQPNEMFEIEDYQTKPEDYEIPTLPNIDEILETSEKEQGQELPYDQSLQYIREKNEEI